MNKKRTTTLSFLVASLIVLFTVLMASGDSAESVREVSVKRGQAVTINLKSNPSTGYRWSAKFDKDFLDLKEESFTRPSNSIPGSPGQQVFVFIAKKAGVTDIDLAYSRSWEHTSVERVMYRVRIVE